MVSSYLACSVVLASSTVVFACVYVYVCVCVCLRVCLSVYVCVCLICALEQMNLQSSTPSLGTPGINLNVALTHSTGTLVHPAPAPSEDDNKDPHQGDSGDTEQSRRNRNDTAGHTPSGDTKEPRRNHSTDDSDDDAKVEPVERVSQWIKRQLKTISADVCQAGSVYGDAYLSVAQRTESSWKQSSVPQTNRFHRPHTDDQP